MLDEQQAMREEIAELRGQVIAWQKQCDTLTHQVICCGVAASHPDATLTTRGAYAGKWNSAQAEEVRKLRAECDQMREERTAWRGTADSEACATAMTPTYYVAHPDGTYSAANPQPRFVGHHMPIELLVAAGHVEREVADKAIEIANNLKETP